MAEVSQTEHGFIFINYRRTDAGWPADHLASKLAGIFGKDRVFLDVREIDAGDNFASDIEEKLRRATILLVLIGKGWLHAQDKYGRRRLDTKDDWVRKEIRRGLKFCRVIPVLIDDAELPDEKKALPNDIKGLLERQRIRIRQANSDDDIEALSRELEKEGLRRLPESGKEKQDSSASAAETQSPQSLLAAGAESLNSLHELDNAIRKTIGPITRFDRKWSAERREDAITQLGLLADTEEVLAKVRQSIAKLRQDRDSIKASPEERKFAESVLACGETILETLGRSQGTPWSGRQELESLVQLLRTGKTPFAETQIRQQADKVNALVDRNFLREADHTLGVLRGKTQGGGGLNKH